VISVLPRVADVQRFGWSVAKLKSVVLLEKTDIVHRCAIEFKPILIRNLLNETYASGYQYNKRYLDWKVNTMGIPHKPWILFGNLLRSISMFKIGYAGNLPYETWAVGIPPGLAPIYRPSWFDTPFKRVGTKNVSINQYARWLEYGRRRQTPKPLFTPTTEEYYQTRMPNQGLKSLARLKGTWGQ